MLAIKRYHSGNTIFIDADGCEFGEVSRNGKTFYPAGEYDRLSIDELKFILYEMNKIVEQQN